MKSRVTAVAAACLAATAAAWLLLTRPRADRAWAADHAVPAVATVTGDLLTVRNIRNFSYAPDGTATPAYYDAGFDLAALRTAWLGITSFSKTSRLPAHTFVSFGFGDGRYLAISVEARREAAESYGIVSGMLRRFELIYVVGDERDLVGRRAAIEGDDTYLYPIAGTREAIRAVLLGMLERANALQQRPEFYHSVWNNCTSNLVRHVNQVAPGRIPSGLKVLVPGYADEVALSLGLIADSTDVATGRRRYLVNRRAREAMGSDTFSLHLRRTLD